VVETKAAVSAQAGAIVPQRSWYVATHVRDDAEVLFHDGD
jgi:hypothetical protein